MVCLFQKVYFVYLGLRIDNAAFFHCLKKFDIFFSIFFTISLKNYYKKWSNGDFEDYSRFVSLLFSE
jgi:hypothetical protein